MAQRSTPSPNSIQTQEVMEANIIIHAAREWTRGIGLSKANTIQTMGALQTRLMMHVLGKKDKIKLK